AVGVDQVLVRGEDVTSEEILREPAGLLVLPILEEILGPLELVRRRGRGREGEGQEESQEEPPHRFASPPQGRGSVRVRWPARTTTSPCTGAQSAPCGGRRSNRTVFT